MLQVPESIEIMKNRRLIPLLTAAAASLLLQACATAPSEPAAKPAPAREEPSKQDLNENLDPVVAEAAKGYERLMKNGVLMFCKRERPVGSNLFTTTCLTEAQLRERAENNKKFHDNTMQQGRRCTQGPACQQG
jgi:outer membrane biogenesis lipoprotein LolB